MQSRDPSTLGDGKRMFATLYPVNHEGDIRLSFARLTEEFGELADAIRVFPAEPGYFPSEAADVVTRSMNVQNHVARSHHREFRDFGLDLETGFARAYPD